MVLIEIPMKFNRMTPVEDWMSDVGNNKHEDNSFNVNDANNDNSSSRRF